MSEEKKTLEWRGRVLDTTGAVLDVLAEITRSGNREDAVEFLKTYREFCDTPEVADSNVGYLLGYLDKDTFAAGLRLFDTRHPIFGGAPAVEDLTTDQAFEMGKAAAAARAEKISEEAKP